MEIEHTSHNPEIINLYEHAFQFISDAGYFSHHNPANKNVIYLIIHMNSLRKSDITEDYMSMYAYNKCDWRNDSIKKQKIPLFFGCIKQYRLNVTPTKEHLPLTSYYDLVKTESSISSSLPTPTTSNPLQNGTFRKIYPAYYTLVQSLASLLKLSTLKDLLIFLYSKRKISFHHYPENIIFDVKNDFYPRVHFLLDMDIVEFTDNLDKFYNLLQMIDKAKQSESIIDEKQLAQTILDLDLTPSNTFASIEVIAHQKNRVSQFCLLLQQYNQKRLPKKTPTPAQYQHHDLIERLNLALPDSFDSTLMDEKEVAFEEFKELLEKIIKLKHSTQGTFQPQHS